MSELENHPRTPQQYVRLFLTGGAMGIADVIPGVSGGTMAFILGIYADLLAAIKSVNSEFLQLLVQFKIKEALGRIPWLFLIPLGLGIGSAILLLARVVRWLLENQPVYLFAFFFGLVLASIFAIGARLKWNVVTLIALAGGTIFAFGVVSVPFLQDPPHDSLTLFFSGMIAISAMLLPGISGSFILLILGQYDYILNAVSDLNLLAIVPVGVGAVIGLVFFSRFVSWLLATYEQPTIAVLVGFMIGSLSVIWPWKEVLTIRIDRHGEEVAATTANVLPLFASTEFAVALVLCLVGFLIVSALDHMQSRANPLFRLVRQSS